MDGDRHRGAQTRAGPVREGDTFTAVIKFLGRRFETPCERTSYEPNRRFTERATAVPSPTSVGPTPSKKCRGTRLTRAVEVEPGGFFKLADPLIERALERLVRADLETLKDLLEARR